MDKTATRASQVFTANYDLTNPEEVAALMTLLETEEERILAIHLAPACGTTSKAREKKPLSFRNKGFKVPGPLRSKAKPMGLDQLAGLDKIRTEAANIVYSATADIIEFCIRHQILCLLEIRRTHCSGTVQKEQRYCRNMLALAFISITACMGIQETKRHDGGQLKTFLTLLLLFVMAITNMPLGTQLP